MAKLIRDSIVNAAQRIRDEMVMRIAADATDVAKRVLEINVNQTAWLAKIEASTRDASATHEQIHGMAFSALRGDRCPGRPDDPAPTVIHPVTS